MKLWTVPEYALFNLNEDIGELNDVSQDHPQVVERLKSKLQTIIIDGRSRN